MCYRDRMKRRDFIKTGIAGSVALASVLRGARLVGAAPRRSVRLQSYSRAAGRALVIKTNQVSGDSTFGWASGVDIVNGLSISQNVSYQPYWESILDIQPDQLIQFLRVNDTIAPVAVDSSTEANNGAHVGTELANAFGPDGILVAHFNGTGCINVYSPGFNADFNGNEFLIDVWIKPENAAVWTDGAIRRIFRFDNNNGVDFISIYKSATPNRLGADYKAGGVLKTVNINGVSGVGWFPLAMRVSVSGNAFDLFIKGLRTSTTQTGLGTWTGNLSSTRTLLGAQSQTFEQPWRGWIALVPVWKTAQITDLEIKQQLHNISSLAWDGITYSEPLAAMPSGLNQHGFVECGGLLYAVAGEGVGNVNTVYAYDPAANTWATKAVVPVSAQSPVVQSVNGKIYCIGGQTSSAVIGDVYEYDPTANQWTQKTSMPTPREDFGSAVVDGKIYCFGGVKPQGSIYKMLEIYNPATDQWTTGADMPDYKLLGDFGAALGGYIYAIGATNTFTDYPVLHTTQTSYRYNPATDQWTTIADVPVSTCYKEVVALNNRLYAVAGCTINTTTYSNVICEYDPGLDSWRTFAAPLAVRGAGLAVYDGAIYMSGGYTGSALTNLYRIR